MVKFGKNKFKALNKIAKSQKIAASSPVQGVSNKILKKKINAERKVTFQKEVLLKEAVVSGNNALVKNVKAAEIILKESKKADKKKAIEQEKLRKPKKPVEKRKKRQKTQIDDTKLMLRLMKKSK